MFRSFSRSDALYLCSSAQKADGDGTVSVHSHDSSLPVSDKLSRVSGYLGRAKFVFPAPDRILDIVVALAALVFVAPLMFFIGIFVMLSSPGPILFRQERLGRGGRTFSCLKIRTMRIDSDALLDKLLADDSAARAEWDRDRKLRSDPRVFAVGHFLRRTSLDELPQLINVLVGDMSIVGPRPIVAAEAVRYRRYITAYFAVRPGITGLWQVSGRNHTTYRRRVACDVVYVRAKSAGNDLRIMAMTVPTVLLARGAY